MAKFTLMVFLIAIYTTGSFAAVTTTVSPQLRQASSTVPTAPATSKLNYLN